MNIFQSLTILLLLFFTHLTHAVDSFEILVFHSYSQEYPWTRNQHEGFIRKLNSSELDDWVIRTEYLDTKRKSFDATYISSLQKYFAVKYDKYTPDLIYVTDDNALNYALDHFQTQFPTTPIIFSGVNDYSIQDRLDETRVAGVFEKKDILKNLQLLRQINPYINDILIIGDDSITYNVIETEIKKELENTPDIKAHFISRHHIDELLSEINNHSTKYLFITTLGGLVDSSGQTLPLNRTLSTLSNTGDYVILSMEDVYITNGILGGFVTSANQQGENAAQLVINYRSGIPIEKIPLITTSPNQYIFNFNALETAGLTLPKSVLEHANIINKPPTFYERYRPSIVILIIVLTIALIASLLFFLFLLARKNSLIQSNSIQTQELEQIIFERTMQLSDEKRKLIQAQQIAHIGNFVWDKKTDTTTWSDELYAITGHSANDFIPSYENYINCIHPDDRELFITKTQGAVAKKEKLSLEYRILRPDNIIRYVYEQGEARADGQNNLTGFVGVVHDITERKITENEYLRLQRELGQARKMEALGQLTGGISHDFNNILGIISGYTNLILDNHKDYLQPTLVSYLENISQAASRAADLVSKMMVFSRSDKGISEPLSFAPLLEESIKMLRSVLPSSIDIQYEFNSDLPDIMMDPIQLHQIMMNLLINAKDAMNGSGTLKIKLDWHRQVNNECNACHKQIVGDWIELSVADNGCGIAANTIDRIFEPFYTTKKVGQGTGMGLSVLNSIVESHDGHILIDTKVGTGTTFHILFPAADEIESSASRMHSDSMQLARSGQGQKILILDDEPSLTGYLSDMLNGYGYVCTACNHSPEALSLLEKNPDAFDLLITDQTMPQLLGTDIIRRIWAINPHFPVILTTGYSDTIKLEQAEAQGIHFMNKPVNNHRLLTLVAELLNPHT